MLTFLITCYFVTLQIQTCEALQSNVALVRGVINGPELDWMETPRSHGTDEGLGWETVTFLLFTWLQSQLKRLYCYSHVQLVNRQG